MTLETRIQAIQGVLSGLPSAMAERWRQTILCTVGTSVLIVVVAMLLPRSFSTTLVFAPQSKAGSESVAGLAATIGLPVLSSEGAQSPQFYVELVGTRGILGALAESDVRVANGRYERVARAIGIQSGDSALEREYALRKLKRLVIATALPRTSTVHLTVTSPDPDLTIQLAQRLVELIERYNSTTRQSQASAERRFAEERLAVVSLARDSAEQRLREFLERNRDSRASPVLQFERDRRERELAIKHAVVASLTQTLERSRIDERRDTPLLNIVQPAERPAVPDGRGLARKALLGLFIGLIAAAALAGREQLRMAAVS